MFGYHLTGDTSLKSIHNYFAHINPIALRIANDIEDIKSAYDYTWNTLTPKRQNAIINDSLIKSDISIKYVNTLVKHDDMNYSDIDAADRNKKRKFCKKDSSTFGDNNIFNMCSFIHEEVAANTNSADNDENYSTYFQKHFGSFSNLTNSQINFKLFERNDDQDNNVYRSISFNNAARDYKVSENYRAAAHNNINFDSKVCQVDVESAIICEKGGAKVHQLNLITCGDIEELSSEYNNYLSAKDQSFMFKNAYQSTLKELYNRNSGNSLLLINSSSSSVASDNDDDSLTVLIQDEKSNHKLLRSENVQAAFDFLNNW